MSSWFVSFGQRVRDYFTNLSPNRIKHVQFGVFFSMGFVSCNLVAFHIASRLNGLTYMQLLIKIFFKFKESKYRKKSIGHQKWKQYFPKSSVRPSTQLMALCDINNAAQTFNLSKFDNDPKKMVITLRNSLKFGMKIIPIHPSFVTKPKHIHDIHSKELNYPGCSAANGVILYVGGGAFIACSPFGTGMLYKLMAKTGCISLAVEYRVCPENNILEAVEDCVNCYKYICNNYKTDTIFLMGDSAGACLVLLALQRLSKYNLKQPTGAVMLSAVCDLSASHKSIVDNKEYEAIIQESGLRACYQMGLGNIDINGKYTGKNVDAKNPLYSPLYASFKGLCPLYFSAAVHEILFDENVETMKKAKSEGVDVRYEWNQSLPHATAFWVIWDVPEAHDSLCKIAVWINQLKTS